MIPGRGVAAPRRGRLPAGPGALLLWVLLLWAAPFDLRAQALGAPDRALLQAAASDDAELAAVALERGADIQARGPEGNTPLHVAAWNGSRTVLALLLEASADPSAKTESGLTPLHHAARQGHVEAVEALAAAGAELEAREARFGNTPLLMAVRGAKRGAAVALLEAGADLEARDRRQDNTALIIAAFDPLRLSVLAELLGRGAEVDARAGDGMTALLAAASRGNAAALQLLLEAGAAVEIGRAHV